MLSLRGLSNALLVVIPLAAFAPTAASAQSETPLPNAISDPRHSFNDPKLQGGVVPDSWEYTGNAKRNPVDGIADLVTGMPNSFGGLWNKIPVDSSDFELNVVLSAKGTTTGEGSGGFGIWMVPEYPSANMPDPSLLGYSNQFDGFATFFSSTDRAGNLNPSISAAKSTKAKAWNNIKDVPSSDGIYFNFRNSQAASPINFRIVATRDHGVKGYVKLQNGIDWKVAFTLKSDFIARNSYLGITAANFGGSDELEVADVFRVHSVKLDHVPAPPELGDGDREMLRNLSGGSQIGDVATLSRLLALHIQQTTSTQDRILGLIKILSDDNKVMAETQLNLHQKIVQLQQPNSLSSAQDDVLKHELRGLKDIVESASKLYDDSIKKSLHEGEDLVVRSQLLEETIRQHGTFSALLMGGLALLVLVMGFIIWRRMKEMEKKHIL